MHEIICIFGEIVPHLSQNVIENFNQIDIYGFVIGGYLSHIVFRI